MVGLLLLLHGGFGVGRLPLEPCELLADASRIRAELGWQPRRSQLAQIIEDAFAAAHLAYSAGE